MSKNIAIADDVYERLKREKGDRSFSEVIRDRLDATSHLAEVAGGRVLDDDAVQAAGADVEALSEGTVSRLDDDAR